VCTFCFCGGVKRKLARSQRAAGVLKTNLPFTCAPERRRRRLFTHKNAEMMQSEKQPFAGRVERETGRGFKWTLGVIRRGCWTRCADPEKWCVHFWPATCWLLYSWWWSLFFVKKYNNAGAGVSECPVTAVLSRWMLPISTKEGLKLLFYIYRDIFKAAALF